MIEKFFSTRNEEVFRVNTCRQVRVFVAVFINSLHWRMSLRCNKYNDNAVAEVEGNKPSSNAFIPRRQNSTLSILSVSKNVKYFFQFRLHCELKGRIFATRPQDPLFRSVIRWILLLRRNVSMQSSFFIPDYHESFMVGVFKWIVDFSFLMKLTPWIFLIQNRFCTSLFMKSLQLCHLMII